MLQEKMECWAESVGKWRIQQMKKQSQDGTNMAFKTTMGHSLAPWQANGTKSTNQQYSADTKQDENKGTTRKKNRKS